MRQYVEPSDLLDRLIVEINTSQATMDEKRQMLVTLKNVTTSFAAVISRAQERFKA